MSINPEHAYVDGCVDVVIQGHHLGTTATASISNDNFESEFDVTAPEEDPDIDDHREDVGFLYTGTVPPSPSTFRGFYDVNLTVDGEELKLFKGFYYQSCPGSFAIDAYDIPASAPSGTLMSFEGCSLDDQVNLVFTDDACNEVGATGVVPLTSECGTARVTAEVPDIGPGSFFVTAVHDDGTVNAFGQYTSPKKKKGPACDGMPIEITGRRGAR
ncbi:MAG: hypothetical protein KTR31_38795 [Myxococcales bacterium]|nr:hypothetical protein [Myxococcales bacterium]